jgi:hypothetical protein
MNESYVKPCPCENCLVLAMCRNKVYNYRKKMLLSELVNDFSHVVSNTVFVICEPVQRYLQAGNITYNFPRCRLDEVIKALNLSCMIR